MYYELINESWKQNRDKSVFFNGNTYPIESAPADFWNAERMQAAENPVYDSATHKLVGPQVINGKVGHVAEPLTPEEIEFAYQMTIPQVVSMRQARVYLNNAGLLEAITTQITTFDDDALITWEYSQEVQRTNPLIPMMAAAFGWTETDLDTMFITAAKL